MKNDTLDRLCLMYFAELKEFLARGNAGTLAVKKLPNWAQSGTRLHDVPTAAKARILQLR